MCYSTASVLKRAFEISFSLTHHQHLVIRFRFITAGDLVSTGLVIIHLFAARSSTAFRFGISFLTYANLIIACAIFAT